MRRGRGNLERGDRECAVGMAALLGALLAFLVGRRCSTSDEPPAVKVTPPPPAPPDRTPIGAFFHWFTWPMRKEDQAKRRLEENPPKAPDPPKESCKKPRHCCCGACGTATEAKPDGDKPGGKDGASDGLMGIVLKVLAAVASGIGVIGAVTVVGAAIFWVRFDAIGVPATQAISMMPKAELLAQGSQEVILFIGIGLAAALFIALADPKGIVTRGTVVVLCAFVLIAAVYVVAKSLPTGLTLILIATALVLALLCVAIAFNTGRKLLPLLVSVFLAALIFSSSCALLIVNDQKYAQAIAIRFGVDSEGVDKGLTGIYVTVTDDTIFFARSGTDPELEELDTTGLYEIHRADTTTYAVGPLEPTEGPGKTEPVQERAESLLARLNADGKSFLPVETDGNKADGKDKQGKGSAQ
jgi:hypothetical protein